MSIEASAYGAASEFPTPSLINRGEPGITGAEPETEATRQSRLSVDQVFRQSRQDSIDWTSCPRIKLRKLDKRGRNARSTSTLRKASHYCVGLEFQVVECPCEGYIVSSPRESTSLIA